MARLIDSIEAKLTQALKDRDSRLVSTLRLLKTALVNERISKTRDLSQDEEQVVVRREVKRRMEAVEIFNQAGNKEKAEQEKQEAALLKSFLPPEMSEEELRSAVQQAMQELSVEQINFGRVMGQVMKKLEGRASGDVVSRIVKEEIDRNNQ